MDVTIADSCEAGLPSVRTGPGMRACQGPGSTRGGRLAGVLVAVTMVWYTAVQ